MLSTEKDKLEVVFDDTDFAGGDIYDLLQPY